MNIAKRINEVNLWLLLLCLAAFFINNSALPLSTPEASNIVTAREIVETGQWLTPTTNGVPQLVTSPLPMWMAAVVESINPRDLSTQRSVAGIMAVMWVLFLYKTARYMSRRRDYATMATIIFLTCYNVVLMGRKATWDIYPHAFMMGGIYFLMRLIYDDRYYISPSPWRNAFWAGIMLGCSFLSRGTVSFYALLLPFLIAMAWSVPMRLRHKWRPLLLAVLLAVLMSASWYVTLWYQQPEALHSAIQSDLQSWLGHHVRPWWYYWRFFAEMGAWAVLVLAALMVPYWRKRVPQPRQYVGAVVFLLAMLALLSLVPEKRMRYLLPLCVPVAYTVAHILLYYRDRHAWDRLAHALFLTHGVLLILFLLSMPLVVHYFLFGRDIVDHGTAIVIDVFCLGMAWYVVRSVRLRRVADMVNGVAAICLVAECFMMVSISRSLTNPERLSVKSIARRDSLRALPFYSAEGAPLRMEMVYEAGKRIRPLQLDDVNKVKQAAPCILLTQRPVKESLPIDAFLQVDTVTLALCNDNVYPKEDRRYTNDLIRYATLLKPKKPQQ